MLLAWQGQGLAFQLALWSENLHRLLRVELLKPEDAIELAAVPTGDDEVHVAVSVHVLRNKGSELAALASRDVVSFPYCRGLSWILEPGQSSHRVGGTHILTILFVRPRTRAARDDVLAAVVVDVGEDQSDRFVRRDRADGVEIPP